MSWLKEVFGHDKVVIGMVHFPPLPGAPLYDDRTGLQTALDRVFQDVEALQAGGMDGMMFCNENDRPYQMRADPVTVATMARAIGEIRPTIRIPFGVDILWDPAAAVAVAKATGGQWVREVFTGTYASDMGLWTTQCGEVLRYRKSIDAGSVRLLFNISAEFASPLGTRGLAEIARSVAFSSLPDGLCVSGVMTGVEVGLSDLEQVKQAVPDQVVLANTGTRAETIARTLSVADGAIVGTGLKLEGVTWNAVDPDRVRAYMAEVRRARGA
ncbi:MAG TPA: BtpA/SgcQ family protein [Anaerolineales bacterium]|nr:BtpA/SgcQ family protein [Anaerolineales bacterium]